MTDAAAAIIAASPNCFLDYNTFVAYREFPGPWDSPMSRCRPPRAVPGASRQS